MIHPLLTSGKLLFVVDGCSHCPIWKEFIEQINEEVEIEDRIEVIDCTLFEDYGIVDDFRILLFMPYIQHEYPILFYKGGRKDGTNTRMEAEDWLRAKLDDKFSLPQDNPYLFRKQCEFIERGRFKKKLFCE